ncbi:S1C family serine protease [Planctomycetes bacterium TBK1r]|uniref:Serine endoprotease DegS n=1 Tax=Stieleria magnilauensis TaxID=2527963 RepID=A0ABX5Y1H9_9BACT|nr:Serine endoprotease DegS [Planctomycetes bacterium TBK1r]
MNRTQMSVVIALVLAFPLASRSAGQSLVDFRDAVRTSEPSLLTVIVDSADAIADPNAADDVAEAAPPRGRRIEILRPDGQPLNRFRDGQARGLVNARPGKTTSAAFAVGDSMVVAFVGGPVNSVTVQNAGGDESEGTVVALDYVTGLAAIKTELAPESGLIVSAAETEPGMPVLAAWIADRGLVTDSGMVSTRAIPTGSGVGTTPTLDFGAGRQMIGAPVLDATGIVVGVLVPSRNGGLVCARSTHLLRLVEAANAPEPHDLKRGLIGIQFEGSGPLVQQVSPGSAAEQAGIEAGDLIQQIDTMAIRDAAEVVAAVADARAGETLQIVVLRGDQTLTLPVTLTEHPDQRIAQNIPDGGAFPAQQAFELRDGQLFPLDIAPGAPPLPPAMRRFRMDELFREFQAPDGPLWRIPRQGEAEGDGFQSERGDVEETLKELQRQMERLNQKLDREND